MRLTPGVKYMIAATFFFALMNVGVKYLQNIPAVEIVFVRSVISLVISFSYLKAKRIHLWGNNKKILFIRGLVGAIALVMFFITLQEIPLASAVTIQFLTPIFTAILGIYIVKEKVHTWQWVFFLISFSGIVIIQGVDLRITPLFAIIGLIAGIFAGLAYNMIRKLNTTENPMVIVFYFPLVTIPVTCIYVAFHWVMPVGIEWLVLVGIGLATQFAQFYMTRAFQVEELSKIASIKYLGIVYALLFGYLLFGETYGWRSYAGIGVVLFGVFLNIWYNQRKTKIIKGGAQPAGELSSK